MMSISTAVSRGAAVVLFAAFAVSTPVVAGAAPAGAAPGTAAPRRTPVPVASTGTIKGTVEVAKSDPANPQPIFKNGCADLVVSGKSSSGAASSATAAGDPASGTCTFTMTAAPGTYTFSATLGGAAVPVAPAGAAATATVTASGAVTALLKVTFPLQPTAAAIAFLDLGGASFVSCETTKVTVVHAMKTFTQNMIPLGNARCKAHFNWVPYGPVTVTVKPTAVNLPPPQTGTVGGGTALILNYVLP